MLRLRSSIVTHLLYSPATSPSSSVQRLLSAAAPRIPPSPGFAVDYLVENCGLTRPQALKASTKISHLKSPCKPDAVLAFLSGLGFSTADVAVLVAKDPKFLCTRVETTVGPNVVELTALGFSQTEIASLVSLIPASFRRRSIVSNVPYYLSLLGSYENLLRVLKNSSTLLFVSLEKVVKPNVAFLRECGLDHCDIAKLCISWPRLISTNLERVHAAVACAESIGVPRGSRMFRQALRAVSFLSKEKVTAQVDYLKNTLGWSDAEVGIAVSKLPMLLVRSKGILHILSEFLISEVGLEPAYIAHRPALLTYSLEGRLRPRYCVIKFLKENGLLSRDRSFFPAVTVTERVFMEKYIIPHDEAAPNLAEDYAAACKGEVPARFIFA
ncbi:hypothetical protein QYE76_049526 [Lolium multiflorum]|uniref:Uncharacterized protein n=1 Tax=Lolium multiflorum TaxID=4521 RepID=A0AAD8SPU0_LOLMU|nr:hypothetical protein QYE76_049526 [Lolium multiflorum]